MDALVKTKPDDTVNGNTQHTKDYSALELSPKANEKITVSGPLAAVFTQALNQAYAKNPLILYKENDDTEVADSGHSQELQGEPNSERDKVSPMVVTADGSLSGLESLLPKSIPEVIAGGKGDQYVYVTAGQESIERIEEIAKEKGQVFRLVIATEYFDNDEALAELKNRVLEYGGKVYHTVLVRQ